MQEETHNHHQRPHHHELTLQDDTEAPITYFYRMTFFAGLKWLCVFGAAMIGRRISKREKFGPKFKKGKQMPPFMFKVVKLMALATFFGLV